MMLLKMAPHSPPMPYLGGLRLDREGANIVVYVYVCVGAHRSHGQLWPLAFKSGVMHFRMLVDLLGIPFVAWKL